MKLSKEKLYNVRILKRCTGRIGGDGNTPYVLSRNRTWQGQYELTTKGGFFHAFFIHSQPDGSEVNDYVYFPVSHVEITETEVAVG